MIITTLVCELWRLQIRCWLRRTYRKHRSTFDVNYSLTKQLVLINKIFSTDLMNLYKNMRIEHGQERVKLARDYENLAKKIARHRNHLTFSHRCKDSSLTHRSTSFNFLSQCDDMILFQSVCIYLHKSEYNLLRVITKKYSYKWKRKSLI